MDVFEHIPDYHTTARHLVGLLRVGGRLYENSPFSAGEASATAIHLAPSMPMHEALVGMKFVSQVGTNPAVKIWEKE